MKHIFKLTKHAKKRMKQRNISLNDIRYIRRNGTFKQNKNRSSYIFETPSMRLIINGKTVITVMHRWDVK